MGSKTVDRPSVKWVDGETEEWEDSRCRRRNPERQRDKRTKVRILLVNWQGSRSGC